MSLTCQKVGARTVCPPESEVSRLDAKNSEASIGSGPMDISNEMARAFAKLKRTIGAEVPKQWNITARGNSVISRGGSISTKGPCPEEFGKGRQCTIETSYTSRLGKDGTLKTDQKTGYTPIENQAVAGKPAASGSRQPASLEGVERK